MPELPELEVLKDVLSNELIGKSIEEPRFLEPYLLKLIIPNYQNRFPAKVSDISRRGKYLLISLENGITLYIHLMKAGRISIQESTTKTNKFVTCSIAIDDGRALRISEYGKEKMAKLYILAADKRPPQFDSLGIEPFDPSLNKTRFLRLLRKEKKRLKQFLTDQRMLAGMGNAYANEILWHVRLSPFSNTTSLHDADAVELLDAIRTVLNHAMEEIRAQLTRTGLPRGHRSFMSVHGKKDEPCPRCGDTIRWVYEVKSTTYYCPTCQTGGRILKDRRTSKFLK